MKFFTNEAICIISIEILFRASNATIFPDPSMVVALLWAGVPMFVEHWGRQFAILPQICPIFNIGGDEPRPRFFSGK